jgi:hypothetical protein
MIKRIRDVIVEVLVAVAIVCLVVFAASRGRQESRVMFRWVGLAVWTALAFGFPLAMLRPYWRRGLFWVSWGGLLAIHLAAYIFILQRIKLDMGSVLILLITIAELRVIVSIIEKILHFDARFGVPPPK